MIKVDFKGNLLKAVKELLNQENKPILNSDNYKFNIHPIKEIDREYNSKDDYMRLSLLNEILEIGAISPMCHF